MSWRLLAGLVAGVFFALAMARLVLHVPKPMLAVAAALFLLCLAVFWSTQRDQRRGMAWKSVLLLLAWASVSGTFFGIAFHLDRSRWLYFKLTGYDVTFSDDKSHLPDATARAFLAYNPTFRPDPRTPDHVFLPRGVHIVDRTLVVPRGTQLTIEPGTVLRFEHGCSLISYSPIVARGTEDDPILFTARDRYRKWGVVGVVGEGRSIFEHVRFEGGRQVRVNGVDFYGTLSLIGASVEIRASRFEHLFGKDAVYVRGGDVLIEDNLFRDVRKDGLDMDGGRGTVSRNRFVDCRDEGIDLSQASEVHVFDNTILDERGGRIGTDRDRSLLEANNTMGHSDNPGRRK